jgi:mannose-6-phosphate isomerase-like protein (cupin superfamily)
MQSFFEFSRKFFVKEVRYVRNPHPEPAEPHLPFGISSVAKPRKPLAAVADAGYHSGRSGGSMKLPFFVVALFVAAIAMFAAQPSLAQTAFTPDQVKYGPAPSFLPPGAQLAVLEGDPMAASGDFTIRFKMPDGYKIAPHTHPHRENVTVLSGTLKVGMGDQFDASKMMSFGAGSFAYLDPSVHHYAMASGATVIQIHGMSPAKFNYINAADDPSTKK